MDDPKGRGGAGEEGLDTGYGKELLAQVDQMIFDTEYLGREPDIKALLLRLIWSVYPKFDPDMIQFANVGRGSPAHVKAYPIYLYLYKRGRRRPRNWIRGVERVFVKQKSRGSL